MKEMRLKILTPEKMVYDQDVSMVVFSAEDGRQGVMPGHVSMVTNVVTGVIQVYEQKNIHQFFISEGIAQITCEEVLFMICEATPINQFNLDAERTEMHNLKKLLDAETEEKNIIILQNKLAKQKVIVDTAIQKV